MYHYLVKETATGKKRLVETSSPAQAVAFCAKDAFTAQRVEGEALELVKGMIPVEKANPPKADETPPPPPEPKTEATEPKTDAPKK